MNFILRLLHQLILIFCIIKSCLSQTNASPDFCDGSCSVEIGVLEHVLDELKSQHAEILNLKSQLSQMTQRLPTNCVEAGGASFKSGIYSIQDARISAAPFTVWCDEETDYGGWMVIQRRVSADVDFYRNWNAYKTGFGDLAGNYWIGLEKLHVLTASTSCEQELYIKMETFDGKKYYVKYELFVVGSGKEDYILKKVANYTGNAQDYLWRLQGCKFSTYDRNNDRKSYYNLAKRSRGGWWYSGWYSQSNLNGDYSQKDNIQSIVWYGIAERKSLKYVQMMIRPTEKCLKRLSIKNGSS